MGSNDMPELGSKISLISKADIRYEGKLFTVDPQDCTIALANVRSFGTEDRVTDHPVPAQNQVYDYILFRATDIQDISVIPNPPMLYDPAIVQVSAPPSITAPGSRYSAAGFHPILGQIGSERPPRGETGGFNPMQSGLNPPIHRPPPTSESTVHSSNNIGLVADLLGSRSSTPGARKSSMSDQGIQAGTGLQSASVSHKVIKSSPPKKREPPITQRSDGTHFNNYPPNNQQQQNRNNQQSRYIYRNDMQQQQRNRYPSGGNMKPIGQPFGGGMRGWGGRGGQQQRGGRGGGRPRQQFNNRQNKSKQPLKFDSDYDFDKANNEFEELRHTLQNQLKISGGEAVQGGGGVAGAGGGGVVGAGGGAGLDDKKDDSGNETTVGDGEPEDDSAAAYDKTKSFFDNISCEAIERSKGRSQRTDWRKELKLNSETFGVPVARHFYMPRGRGGSGYYKGGWNNLQYKQRQQNIQVAKA